MRVPKRAVALVLLLAAVAVGVSSCSPGYVLRAAWEEMKILRRRQPIAKMVADPATEPETREKLKLVLEARGFAADSLRLKAGKSYTLFSRVESDTLALVLSAARRDRFEAHTWWFPIVGHVPYKGFFREADARKEMAKLEAKGFDVYLRPTSAFSTLGWFTDPLLSSLLRYDSVSLANTVIHEITHNTFYAGGQAMFNESFASFVGSRGAIDFFCGRGAAEAANCERAKGEWEDDLVFGAFMERMVTDLEALYGRADLTSEQKVAQREDVFRRSLQVFRDSIQPRLKVGTYASFERGPLNNATLISRRLYYGRLDLFERVFQSRGGDLRRSIEDVVRAAKGAKDPYAAVEALLAAPAAAPASAAPAPPPSQTPDAAPSPSPGEEAAPSDPPGAGPTAPRGAPGA